MPDDVRRPRERRIDVEKDTVGDEPEEIARTHWQPRAGRRRAAPRLPQAIEDAQSQLFNVRVEAAPLQDRRTMAGAEMDGKKSSMSA